MSTHLPITMGGTLRCPKGQCSQHQCRHHEPGAHQGCVLRQVEQAGNMTLDHIGQVLGVTRERVRQIQNKALAHAARVAHKIGIDRDVLPPECAPHWSDTEPTSWAHGTITSKQGRDRHIKDRARRNARRRERRQQQRAARQDTI